MTDFNTLLDRLALTAVKVGLNIEKGQEVIVSAPIETAPLVRLIAKHAYANGASLVTPFFNDDATTLARYENASEESFDTAATWLAEGIGKAYKSGAARLGITGGNPCLLQGQNPEHISRVSKAASIAYRPAMEAITRLETNWTIIGAATQDWATQVFPDLSPEKALSKLWDGIFKASRVDNEDPIQAWAEHNAAIHKSAKKLNDQRFDALHFTGNGSDLTVGLADGHHWAGGAAKTAKGRMCNANLPTEEVFTTPHMNGVNGTIRNAKPLFHQGSIIDGMEVTFKDGKIIKAHAEKGNDVFQRLIATDAGACRLGEVALVPHSSPISASGILYRNTLFDENASSHLALGQSYSKCMLDTDNITQEELASRGANSSIIHVDWMVGSPETDVDGIKDGKVTPVMRKGEWV